MILQLDQNPTIRVISGIRRKFILCKCGCGKEFHARQDHLSRKKDPIKSCGCSKSAKGRRAPNLLPPGVAAARNVFNNYRSKCRLKGIVFNLSFERFVELAKMDCFYCGGEPNSRHGEMFVTGVRAGHKKVNGTFVYNGIDRVEPSGGYIEGNVVPCCGLCNLAKGAKPQTEFFAWIDRLTAYRASQR